MSEKIRVTYENVDSLKYTPAPGIEYEIADGCIRTMKRPFYDIVMQYDKLVSREDSSVLDPESDKYGPKLRLEAVRLITEGDPIPKSGGDIKIVGRIVADFFTFRIMTTAQPVNSSQ